MNGADAANAGWHTEELRISLVLDQPIPEALEFRRITADQDRLNEINLALTLTAPPGGSEPLSIEEFSVDVFYGGTLIRKAIESTNRFGLNLVLPHPLNRHGKHDFALRYRIANPPALWPHYVCVPRHRCDLFDLHVRFDLDQLPARVWRLSDAFQRDVDDPSPSGEMLFPDKVGEVHATFRLLTPGLAYGLRWTPSRAPTSATGAMVH